ncbi:MAG: hypothetical protein F6K58_06570 [Symploca sp. SIO2E9]|nr:hypothetical protein [Symploca sp. SIO2E9]
MAHARRAITRRVNGGLLTGFLKSQPLIIPLLPLSSLDYFIDAETRRCGDRSTRRRGDAETRRLIYHRH